MLDLPHQTAMEIDMPAMEIDMPMRCSAVDDGMDFWQEKEDFVLDLPRPTAMEIDMSFLVDDGAVDQMEIDMSFLVDDGAVDQMEIDMSFLVDDGAVDQMEIDMSFSVDDGEVDEMDFIWDSPAQNSSINRKRSRSPGPEETADDNYLPKKRPRCDSRRNLAVHWRCTTDVNRGSMGRSAEQMICAL